MGLVSLLGCATCSLPPLRCMLQSSIGQQVQGPRAFVSAQAGVEFEEQADIESTGKGTNEDSRGGWVNLLADAGL